MQQNEKPTTPVDRPLDSDLPGSNGTAAIASPPTLPSLVKRYAQNAYFLAKETTKAIALRPAYAAYERRLTAKAATWQLPRHIALVMDGNRRFARLTGLGELRLGHERGAEKVFELLGWCYELRIPVVTLWGFSLDNFQRVETEVSSLMEIIERKTRELHRHPSVHRNRVRIRFIGRLDLLPASLRSAIREVEAVTAGYGDFLVNLAIAYSGREEIADACRRYLEEQVRSGASLEEAAASFTDDTISRYLYTSGQPEPDLIVRTSGEVRLSGFLLWQGAQSEYYFCDAYWPAFRKIDFLRALRAYHFRQRRFGR
ncbi:MAG: di-trans,poly-cis-decaprenylcistransferase [Candidatus Schekmanbacteria bacterium]|nr:di-trans,poly-cis-decaprenylcistransferase [Candidatus Schekmanbacteria bacterium]